MKLRKLPLALAAVALGAGLAWASGQTLSVQVREGQLRSQPSFLSAVVATLPYGQPVREVAEQGAWRQVQSGQGPAGWMHISSLTSKKVVLQGGQGVSGGGASGEEMALAGKGFNKDVESDFAANNRGADFGSVNRMEQSYIFPVEQLSAFVREGGLVPAQGGE